MGGFFEQVVYSVSTLQEVNVSIDISDSSLAVRR